MAVYYEHDDDINSEAWTTEVHVTRHAVERAMQRAPSLAKRTEEEVRAMLIGAAVEGLRRELFVGSGVYVELDGVPGVLMLGDDPDISGTLNAVTTFIDHTALTVENGDPLGVFGYLLRTPREDEACCAEEVSA